MKFRTLILAAVLVSAAGFALWKWRESHLAAARRANTWTDQQHLQTTESLLQQQIDFSGQRLTLEELAAFISQASELSVELDLPVLEAAGVARTHAILLPQGRMSIGAALRHSLEGAHICYDLFDRRLIITTPESSRDWNALRTVTYPLPQPELAGSGIAAEHSPEILIGYTGYLPPLQPPAGGASDADAWEDLLTQLVASEEWAPVGGLGHCQAVPGALVIAQTEHVHRQIVHFWRALSHLESQPVSRAPVPLDPFLTSPAEQKISAALDQPAGLESVHGPLDQMLAELARRHDIPIVLQERKLLEEGVAADAIISLDAPGVSLQSFLQLALRQHDLAMIVRDEALCITWPYDAQSPEKMSLVAYPVHDLVASPNGPDYDQLIDLVTTLVAPERWVDVGGEGSLEPLGGWLLVAHSLDVHRKIERLFADLRRHLQQDQSPLVLGASVPTPAEERIRQAMDRELPLRFVEEPLLTAMERIASQFGIPIVVNANKLKESGIDPAAIINCDLPAAPLDGQLRLILRDLRLEFVVRNEVLYVSAPDEIESPDEMSTRAYDTRLLLDRDLGVTDADGLADLVTTLIRPGEWTDVGGPASIKEFQGLLVVSAHDSTHQQLNRLLVGLKRHCLRTVMPGVEPPTVVKFDATPGEAVIEAALAKTIDLDLNETPLEAALNLLAAEHGLPLLIDRRALAEAGIDTGQSVSLLLHGITLRSALRQILEPLELTWRIRHDVLQITTRERRSELPIVAYRVGDFADSRRERDDGWIMDAIENAIVPDEWEDVGGTGAITSIDGWLLVAHEHAVHDQIEQLLSQLRAALSEPGGPAVRDVAPPSPTDARIRAALEQDMHFDFDSRPLVEVAHRIGERFGIPVVVRHKKLEEAGISADRPVTCHLEPAPLASQLRLLLEPLELTFVVRHESLLITTPQDAEDVEQMPICVYDARGLVNPDSGIGTADGLTDHIQSLIAPDSWSDTGGPGSISDFRGLLIVSQTEEVHEQLAALLAALGEHALGKFVPPPDWQGFVDVRSSRAEQRIEAMLAEPIDVDLCGEPLEHALHRLADRLNLPLVIDERSTEWELWPQRLVTYSTRGQRLGHVLDRLLLPHSMTYDIRHNVVLILAAVSVDSPSQMRLYHTVGLPQLEASDLWSQQARLMLDADAWVTEGGVTRLQQVTDDWLVVVAPIRAHDRIADRLAELRMGVPPPRELARRALARELEIISWHPEPRVYGRDWDRAAEEDPFR